MICNTVRDFYATLYSTSANPDRVAAQATLFSSISIPGLNAGQRLAIDAPVTLDELFQVAKSCTSGKSPGFDGLPIEFYLAFWRLLGPLLLEVIEYVLSSDDLPPSWSVSIVSLLYKKGDRHDIRNWRPISLINSDVKLVCKLFAHRLNGFLPSLLHPLQHQCPGRWIMDAVHNVQSVYHKAKVDPSFAACLLFLDQEKAFDRVDHAFLFKMLVHRGFAPSGLFYRSSFVLESYSHGQSQRSPHSFFSDLERSEARRSLVSFAVLFGH